MGKLDAAADGLRSLAEQVRPLLDVAEVLKGLGSIEQAVIDTKAAYDAATADLDKVKGQLKTQKKRNDDLVAEQDASIAAAQASAAGILDAAQRAADDLTASTMSNNEAKINAANAEIDRIQLNHQLALSAVDNQVAAANDELKIIQAQRDLLLAQQAEIYESIESMKKIAKSLV